MPMGRARGMTSDRAPIQLVAYLVAKRRVAQRTSRMKKSKIHVVQLGFAAQIRLSCNFRDSNEGV